MNKKLPILIGFYALSYVGYAQDSEYYKAAFGKKDAELKTALSAIIKNAKTVTYDNLLDLYKSTDMRKDGKVWDIYSNATSYSFNQSCGSYSGEGSCYNREHSIPQSWFNKANPMKSDAWHVVPTDGYVNGRRSNYPFGEVGTTTYTSKNDFSKLGHSVTEGFKGTVFEPNDEYKGDIARIYFYMATRYENSVGSWTGGVFSSSYPHLQTWVVNLMLKWHRQDPVSEKETDRNIAMHKGEQGNRNPFIDYPHLAELIFGNRKGEIFIDDNDGSGGGDITDPAEKFELYDADNITDSSFRINWKKGENNNDYLIDVYTIDGAQGEQVTLFDFDFTSGEAPEGWSHSGTYKDPDGFRLGTANNTGLLTSTEIDLSQEVTLSINCKSYNDDNSTLFVYVDDILVFSVNCPANKIINQDINLTGTNKSKIMLKAINKKRVVLYALKAETGLSTTERLDGYPIMTGDVNNHVVNDLTKNTTYYYSVTPFSDDNEGESSVKIGRASCRERVYVLV